MDTPTIAQYKSAKDRLRRFENAREEFDPKKFKRGGGYSPEDNKAICKLAGLRSAPTNDDRHICNVFEHVHAPGVPSDLAGYVTKGHLSFFTGEPLPGVSSLHVTHTEKLRNNPYSSYRYSYEATFRGHRYSGRGYGEGMSLILKLRK